MEELVYNQWLAMLLLVNSTGLVLLVLIIIKWSPKPQDMNLPGYRGNDGQDNDDGDQGGGGWGYDPKLPVVDLPPGSSLGDWLTDRPERSKDPVKK